MVPVVSVVDVVSVVAVVGVVPAVTVVSVVAVVSVVRVVSVFCSTCGRCSIVIVLHYRIIVQYCNQNIKQTTPITNQKNNCITNIASCIFIQEEKTP